jgi:hypothetical protein
MSVYLHSQVFNRSNKSQHSQTIHPILKEKKKKEKQNGKEQTEKPQTSNNKVEGEEQDGEL